MKKIRILEAVNQLGLGGTEYGVQLFSKFLNKNYFDVKVVSLLQGGERVEIIEKLGVEVIVLNGDFSLLDKLLEGIDVFHWHGGGSCEPDHKLFESLKINRPKLIIQTNVFGAFDNSPFYELIDFDLYVSKMILIRRMHIDSGSAEVYRHKRKVLPNPVDIDEIRNALPTEEQIRRFKTDNHLEGCYIVGRIGRADNHKFDLITLDGFAAFATQVKNAKFILVGSTPEIITHARRLGISDKLVILNTTIDFRMLLIYYKSMDVFLAASNIGESFGMVIAEAMSVGTPVVTISTEDRDNAQIELIDNQKSGLVVKRKKSAIASALRYLYENKQSSDDIAYEASKKIERDYKAQKVIQSFEKLIFNHFSMPNDPTYKAADLLEHYSDEMINDYKRRCTNLYERPTLIRKIKSVLKVIKIGL